MFLLILVLFISITILAFSWYCGISPMPSSRATKEIIIKNVPKRVKNLYELGSGWGGLACQIARTHPNIQVTGFEISPFVWLISKLRQKITQTTNLNFYIKNFFNHSLVEAEVVVCYLYPGAMKKLKIKFEKELQPGSWVFSNTFAIPGWEPYQVFQLEDLWKTQIWVYRVATSGFVTAAITRPAKNQAMTKSKKATRV